MKHRFVRLALVSALAASPLAALAKDAPEQVVKADTPEKFALVISRVHEEMKPGGRYEFMNRSGRDEIDRNFDEMTGLLRKIGSVAAMNDSTRVALFNRQEKINGILSSNASDRLVCRSVAPVGSHIPLQSCKTFGELAQNRDALQKTIATHQGMKFTDDFTRGNPGATNWNLPGSMPEGRHPGGGH